MKILFVGDIVGECGVEYLIKNLDEIKKTYKINLVIVNGENSSNSNGISQKAYKDLMRAGVCAITMGNHTFSNKDINDLINNNANIVIPANYPFNPKNGYITIKYNNETVTIINLLGRVFINFPLDCPFKKVKEILENVKSDYYIIDFHAEATSEKISLGYYVDGIKGAVVGTHTHVPTCDERILEKGTMYITDVGMTGPLDGVIGVKKEIIESKFVEGKPIKGIVASGRMQLNAVVLDFDNQKITRINIKDK